MSILSPKPCPRNPLGVGSDEMLGAFGHYPSQSQLELHDRVVAGLDSVRLGSALFDKSDSRRDVIGYCLQPRSLTALDQKFGTGASLVAVQLMKKGFLRVVPEAKA